MEAHYEAAHSHSPSPPLIFPFKKWGTQNIFAHSCLLSPDGGGWWGAGWHPYQLLQPDVARNISCNKANVTELNARLCRYRFICLMDPLSSVYAHSKRIRKQYNKNCSSVVSSAVRLTLYLQSPWSPVKGFSSKAQAMRPLGELKKAKDVLTEGVDARLAGDRSELWGSAWSWGIGLLRHRGPWLHTWSAGFLSLGESGTGKRMF